MKNIFENLLSVIKSTYSDPEDIIGGRWVSGG
jgi:hypothetical protein